MDKQIAKRTETDIISHNDANAGLSHFNLFDSKQLTAAEVFLKKIIPSKKSGIKTIEDGLSVLMRAQDLNLPFSTCLEHIHVINDKTGIDIHIVKALLLRAGVTWECTKDYAPQYQYTDGNSVYLETQVPSYCVKCRTAKEAADKTNDDTVGIYPVKWYKDLNGNIYNEFQINSKCVIALNQVQATKLAAEGKFPVIRIANQPVDFVTEYKFTRYKTINGKEREMSAISHFSFNEAQTAELFKKDTYIKYARILIGHRAFTLGARDIAADVLMGVMEAGELKIVEDVDLSPQDVEIVEEVDN
jgi:hypothetical protein